MLIPVVFCVLAAQIVFAARASFSVHFPWATRAPPPRARPGLRQYNPFCGDIIHNPQRFGAYTPTFVSFSGNAGDLVSIRYTRSRSPKSPVDFREIVATDVPIAPSGQLCFDVQMPFIPRLGEMGVLLFEARDPVGGSIEYFCSDVRLIDVDILGDLHPAMCAKNNETLIPMPTEFL